jgi:hypothetical protein
MRALGKVEQRRKQMLLELGRQGVLKNELHRTLQASGVRDGVAAMKPDRFRPAMDTTQTAMQKWVQAALNVVTGLKLKLDGNLGPISRTALRRFQREEGLPAHGYADEKTLQVLELRVGVSCPRGGHHEPIPSLLRLPMRNVWMPKPKPKGREGREREAEAGGGAAVVAAGAQKRRELTAADSYADPAARPGAAGVSDDATQRESMMAVRALAFTPGFAERAAEHLDAHDAASVHVAMERWADEQLARADERAPAWIRTIRADARGNAGEAASMLRRAWWACHIGEGEGL